MRVLTSDKMVLKRFRYAANALNLNASRLTVSASLSAGTAAIFVSASTAETDQRKSPPRVRKSGSCLANFSEQDYLRWKNMVKNSEKNHRKAIRNKLEYVFMPAGSLYSLMISKMNHQ